MAPFPMDMESIDLYMDLYGSIDTSQPIWSSIDERIKSMWYLHTMEYYFARKKDKWLICRKIDAPCDHKVKWNKSHASVNVTDVSYMGNPQYK